MDLKAMLAAKKAAKDAENKPAVVETPVLVLGDSVRTIEIDPDTKQAVVESDAEDSITDSSILNSSNDEEDDTAGFWEQGTEFDANHIIESEPDLPVSGVVVPVTNAEWEAAVDAMPPAAVPAEAFAPAKPMSFKEKIALQKAQREAAGGVVAPTPPTQASKNAIREQLASAQDKLRAIEAQQAARRKQVEADAKALAEQIEAATKVNEEKETQATAEANRKASAQYVQDELARQAAEREAEEADKLSKIAEARAKLVPAMKTEIKSTVGKMSLADRLAMRKIGQEEAKKAVEEMELASEPPEELPASLVGEVSDLAVIKAYEDEIVDLDGMADGHGASDVGEDAGTFSLNIVLNARQLLAKEMALAGKCFALIGAAGTGKTTTQRSVAETLVEDSRLRTSSFKVVGGAPGSRVSAPSIAFVAYTRRASANLARAIHKSPTLAETLAHNIMTVHALLEFEPETFWNDEKQKEDFRFIPRRNAQNPLNITHLVIEEASMLGLDLWENLFDALPHGVQIIFIGDINQLPPVFGASILNYALVQLPIVELTEVYRNAGIVLASAHNVLAGKFPIEGESQDDEGNMTGKVTIVRGKSPVQVGQGKMAMSLGKMFKMWYDMGYYDPEDCMILSPWNKKDLGTDNMNSWIAQFLGDKRGAVVWEVISGFNKLYLAVGDKVMFNKQDAIITDIKFNGMYHGKDPQPCGTDLGRFGVRILGAEHIHDMEVGDQLLTYSNFSVDELEETAMERKQQASHVVTIQTETGQIISLSAAGDFGPQVFSLGYVLTVHKAQGCEWKKVFFILHKDHAVSLSRELFYTGLTRARLECILIAKDTVIQKAIDTQRIKGNTLADKVEFFNSGAMDIGAVSCVK